MKAYAICICLTGCAVAPDYVRPELYHDSHITQHPPFTATNGHVGSSGVGITAEWQINRLQIELNESVNLCRGWTMNGVNGYGETQGPREEFSARIGYNFKVPK